MNSYFYLLFSLSHFHCHSHSHSVPMLIHTSSGPFFVYFGDFESSSKKQISNLLKTFLNFIFPFFQIQYIICAHDKGKFMHFSSYVSYASSCLSYLCLFLSLSPSPALFLLPAIIVFNIPACCQVGNFPLKTSSLSLLLLFVVCCCWHHNL